MVKVLIGDTEYVKKVVLESDSSLLEQALEYRSEMSSLGYCSIREYLTKLLLDLYNNQESFNSKRPFGNSGWYLDLWRPLFIGGFVRGTIKSYSDDPEDYEIKYYEGISSLPYADDFVKDLISYMCSQK